MGFIKKRQNVLGATVVLFVVALKEPNFTRVPILGFEFENIGHLEVIGFGWILLTYFVVRASQDWWENERSKVGGTFLSYRKSKAFLYMNRTAVPIVVGLPDYKPRKGTPIGITDPDHELKSMSNVFARDFFFYQYPTNSESKPTDYHQYEVPKKLKLILRLRDIWFSLVFLLRNGKTFTEVGIPLIFVLATGIYTVWKFSDQIPNSFSQGFTAPEVKEEIPKLVEFDSTSTLESDTELIVQDTLRPEKTANMDSVKSQSPASDTTASIQSNH